MFKIEEKAVTATKMLIIKTINCANGLNFSFPNSLTLNNGTNVLLVNDGIHFFDSSFTIEDSDKAYIFSNDGYKISSKDCYSKSEMTQFSEDDGNYIMILAMNIIYFLVWLKININ